MTFAITCCDYVVIPKIYMECTLKFKVSLKTCRGGPYCFNLYFYFKFIFSLTNTNMQVGPVSLNIKLGNPADYGLCDVFNVDNINLRLPGITVGPWNWSFPGCTSAPISWFIPRNSCGGKLKGTFDMHGNPPWGFKLPVLNVGKIMKGKMPSPLNTIFGGNFCGLLKFSNLLVG
jgi:hypothetical protein